MSQYNLKSPRHNNNNGIIILAIAIFTLACVIVIFGVVFLLRDRQKEEEKKQDNIAIVDERGNEGASSYRDNPTPDKIEREKTVTAKKEVASEESMTSPSVSQSSFYRVTKNIFVRTGPGTDYDTKYSPYSDYESNNTNGVVVFKGTIVERLGEEVNGFVKVKQTSQNNDRDSWGIGWISARYIELSY